MATSIYLSSNYGDFGAFSQKNSHGTRFYFVTVGVKSPHQKKKKKKKEEKRGKKNKLDPAGSQKIKIFLNFSTFPSSLEPNLAKSS
jgi:hypothetical protein